MNTKTQQPIKEFDPFPFEIHQLKFFRKEITRTGGFKNLMFEKQALSMNNGIQEILKQYKVEEYKKKFLKGPYRQLWDYYDTDIPYLFWDEMLSALERYEEAYA